MFTGRFMSLFALALAGGIASAAVPVAAQDARIESLLDRTEMSYKRDEDGDYAVVFNYSKENRTQLAYVSGTTQTVGGITIREIFSPAAGVKESGVDGAKALELLTASGRTKVGSWEIRGNIIFFVIKVIDNMTAAELKSLLNAAAATADDLEIELTGGKDDL
jgi:hypothetical protein